MLRGYLAKADDKLGVARRLRTQGDFEDAISRVYYAAFHAAQALLLAEGLSSRSHGGLVTLFGLHFVKAGKIDKKYGRFLSNLTEDRQQSDYGLFSGLEQPDAEHAVAGAEEFVQEIRRHLTAYL
jgi:uncharacterized protein (UPF0332 family)